MKLGLLLDHAGPTAGGAEAHSDALLRRAVEAGEGAALACLSGEAPSGVETIRVAAPRRRPARDRAFAADGVARLRAAGCDVVLALRHAPTCDVYLPHGGLVEDALRAHDLAAGGLSFPRALARRLSGRHAFFREAERAVLAGPDGPRVICVSHGLAQRVRQRFPAAGGRLVVIPNGVDGAHFSRAPHADAGRRLRQDLGVGSAYVGLLLAANPLLKGARTAVEALGRPAVRALDPPFRLLVVGGPLPRRVRRLAARLGVTSALLERPHVEDPRPWYAAADVLVHPTFHDPCSLACLEALAMELPVITTPPNGVRELMGMRGGIAVEAAGDPEAIACALGVLADPALRAVTAEDARTIALRNRLSRRLDQVLDVCRAVVRET